MKDKKLSAVTIIVGVVAVAGLIAAVAIPSLLRARMPAGYVRTPMDRYRARPPRPTRPSPGSQDAGALGSAPSPAKLAHREMAEGRTPAMNTEAYARIYDNAFLAVATNPLSTFSIDVDTASYANVRRFLNAGQLPPPDAVRIEELINYFRFDYPPPEGDAPFSVTTQRRGLPVEAGDTLVHVGLQGAASTTRRCRRATWSSSSTSRAR